MVNYITFTQPYVQAPGGIKTFYFNSYDAAEKWETRPGEMVDGNTSTFANTFVDLKVQLCDENTCTETSDSVVTKVEIRALSLCANFTGTLTAYMQPVFPGGDGDTHSWIPPSDTSAEPPDWTEWFDITNDTNAPGTWHWGDVIALDMDIYPDLPTGVDPYSMFVGKIEVRTTSTPITAISTCTMIAPEEVSTNHAQNIKEMNMWNGERIVFGESRSKWSLLLKGGDWENDACDRILCLKQLGLKGLPLTISDLGNPNWDTEWMIKSFGWKLIYEKPIHYEWIILLEKT